MSPTSSPPGPNATSIRSRLQPAASPSEAPRNVVVRETRASKFQQTVTTGPHQMLADEPVAAGGQDTGPGPYDFVLAGLGACTSMTMRMYADRKSLPLDRITVTLKHSKIHAEDCAECETREGMLDQIDRVIAIEGALDADAAQAVDGDRRQVPGAPDADVGNSYRDEGRGVTATPPPAAGRGARRAGRAPCRP